MAPASGNMCMVHMHICVNNNMCMCMCMCDVNKTGELGKVLSGNVRLRGGDPPNGPR